MKGDGSGTVIVRTHISRGLTGSQASGQAKCFPSTELCHLHLNTSYGQGLLLKGCGWDSLHKHLLCVKVSLITDMSELLRGCIRVGSSWFLGLVPFLGLEN